MPRGDGTGPMGYGPLTGRGAGYCAGYINAPGPGYGYGRGRGRGRAMRRFGFRPDWPAAYNYGGYGFTPVQDQKSFLQQQADDLEEELKFVREQLKKMDEE